MRIALVNVGSTLNALGLRMVAASVRTNFGHVDLFFIIPANQKNLWTILRDTTMTRLADEDIAAIAKELAGFDLVGFSCMSENFEDVKKIIQAIRDLNTGSYLVLGGVHATLYPDEAIQYADAVCTGEGEQAFPDLLQRLETGADYADVANFWFKGKDGLITKSPTRTLAGPMDLDNFPFPEYSYTHEMVYRKNRKMFTDITRRDFLLSESLSYHAIWTRGCPFKCSYCFNSRLNQLNGSSRIRYSSVDRMIAEIQNARTIFPHLSTIMFMDDSFISVPMPLLEEFAAKWLVRVNLPFWVFGVNPIHFKKEKIDVLVGAGMVGLRVGLQSGSEKILKLYQRPGRPALFNDISTAISNYNDYIIPPLYDIIVDNPVETSEDIEASLRLVNGLKRPCTVLLFSLRYIPNTELGNRFEQLGIDLPSMEKRRYSTINPTWPNVLMAVCVVIQLPDALFARVLPWVMARMEIRPILGLSLLFLRILAITRRVSHLIVRLDFSEAFGRAGWLLWKIGILQFAWRRSMKKRAAAFGASRGERAEFIEKIPSEYNDA